MSNAGKPRTKSDIFATIADETGLKKKDISNVFDALSNIIRQDLKSGPGVVNLAGLMKIKAVHKPAVPEREGINPFTKEPTIFKAKPARNVVKISPLKSLKDMV